MATEDARYRQSSQYRLWSFTPAQLRDMRTKTSALAISHISARLTELASTSAQGDQKAQSEAGAAPVPPADFALPEFLTPAEELQLLTFYTAELLRAAAFIELPTDIRATAAIFLRRFYVTNSIMTYPPTELLKTALFFGAKAEGHYTRLSRFAEKFPNTTPEEVLAGEFLLCQGIRFAFDVRHPFRALEGAIMDLRQMGGVDETTLVEAHRRAREILKFSPLMTDAYFHFTPSQIMLAALSLADRGLVERILHRTFHVSSTAGGDSEGNKDGETAPQAVDAEKVAAATAGDIRDKVLGIIEACREMLATELPERATDYWGTPEANKALKPLIKKLKKCRDPDRWDLVALQRAKREQSSGGGGGKGAKSSGADGGAAAESKGRETGTLESDAAVFGSSLKDPARDAKRRKVLDDPFGPGLG